MTVTEITKLLKKEMEPAYGCTGPTAYALATSCCKPYITAPPERIEIYVSPSFLKMGFGVATPGTSQPGIEIAAALGLISGDYTQGMQVLRSSTSDDMEKANELMQKGIIHILCDREKTGVYVRAVVTTGNESVIAVVEHTHDGVSLIEVNGQEKFRAVLTELRIEEQSEKFTLEEIFSYVRDVSTADLYFLVEGYKLNLKLAEDGLKNKFGLMSGRAYLTKYWKDRGIPDDLFEHPMDYLPDSISERSKVLVAAASDARMGGSRLPAMAAMGDGNQGITALIPVGTVAEMMKTSDDRCIRALALSCLLLFYVKMNIGRAAAFCLCAIAASAGSVGGIAYLYGLSEKQISAAVKNAISPLTGMLCDGAKNACALKMAIATSTAFMAVDLAEADVQVGYYDGVANNSLPDTVACITRIANNSMEMLDKFMVDEILKKSDPSM